MPNRRTSTFRAEMVTLVTKCDNYVNSRQFVVIQQLKQLATAVLRPSSGVLHFSDLRAWPICETLPQQELQRNHTTEHPTKLPNTAGC